MDKKSSNREPTIQDVLDSVDSLAIATKNGFDRLENNLNEFKGEMYKFKKDTELTLFKVNSKLQNVDQRLDAIEKALGPLAATSIAMQNEIRSLNLRLDAVEHKIGMK